jgi:toxin YoeB
LPKKRKGEASRAPQRDAVFQAEFRDDLRYWVETDRRTALRILALVEAVMREPFSGVGKPEALKYLGADVWSRRITQEHRLVYVVGNDRIDFIQARYHYQISIARERLTPCAVQHGHTEKPLAWDGFGRAF